MAQAFVQKVFHEKKTNSTIQVPTEESLLDEENVKKVIETTAKAFFEQEKKAEEVSKEQSQRGYLLACAVVKDIIADCQSAQEHKVVVNVFISEQEGQGLNFGGQCLWNSDCDKVVSTNMSSEGEVCVITAFFSKIPQDSSSSDEDEEGSWQLYEIIK